MILLDTGPTLAAADRSDEHHRRWAPFLAQPPDRLLMPAPVINEVCHHLCQRAGPPAEAAFLYGLSRTTSIDITHPVTEDLLRAAQLVEQYADNNIGYVDAVAVAIAERHGIIQVATVDLRHYTVIRPAHAVAFVLV